MLNKEYVLVDIYYELHQILFQNPSAFLCCYSQIQSDANNLYPVQYSIRSSTVHRRALANIQVVIVCALRKSFCLCS